MGCAGIEVAGCGSARSSWRYHATTEALEIVALDHHPKSGTLALLSQSERALVETIMNSASDLDDLAFTRLAGLRLRNIVEKYSEELKRTRLAARSGDPDGAIDALEDKLSLCREALHICNTRLSLADDQD